MNKQFGSLYLFIFFLFPLSLFGQHQRNFELTKLFKKSELRAVNREMQLVSNDSKPYLQISENEKEGIVWLPLREFREGTIKVVMRGKDVLQRSFIGLVFNGVNDSTYDAVYCRPFNFFATDSVRRIHAIQYISHPIYTWEKLRKERNAVFEKEIINPPNPNDWFTMKLVIDDLTVKAYINNAKIPSLIVEKLNIRKTGKIGLFTGSGSGGDFKKVKIN